MIDDDTARGIDVALNEASWLSASVIAPTTTVELVVEVLTLPPIGPAPSDCRRRLRLSGVSRVIASYRVGSVDAPAVTLQPLVPEGLTALLEDFGTLPVYGWEFVDAGDEQFERWRENPSFDVELGGVGEHTLDLFQEDGTRLMEFRAYFDALEVLDHLGIEVPMVEFISGGRRWWDAMYAGDKRTQGSGIVPGRP